ncbi:hypothetical protein [Candidatus Tisiphia endosymbiont of Nemotelus uliginosus]|uniref:hypothetical protein n=1 Tax=Candidatus Tisiphia endosymbiont of Nemotelus uliginosus TaxID=3077926 RepID=UPI0035C90F26
MLSIKTLEKLSKYLSKFSVDEALGRVAPVTKEQKLEKTLFRQVIAEGIKQQNPSSSHNTLLEAAKKLAEPARSYLQPLSEKEESKSHVKTLSERAIKKRIRGKGL